MLEFFRVMFGYQFMVRALVVGALVSLCAALLADAPFPQAVSLAVRAASLSVAQPRAVASFPTREALEASVRSAPAREK